MEPPRSRCKHRPATRPPLKQPLARSLLKLPGIPYAKRKRHTSALQKSHRPNLRYWVDLFNARVAYAGRLPTKIGAVVGAALPPAGSTVRPSVSNVREGSLREISNCCTGLSGLKTRPLFGGLLPSINQN